MSETTTAPVQDLREYVLPGAARAEHVPPPRDATGIAPPVTPRVVGPGRRERGYLERLAGLARDLEDVRRRAGEQDLHLQGSRSALEVSQRVERGCQRRIDRLESFLEARTQALLASERQHKQLALALGALQQEVLALRRENQLLRAPDGPALLGAPEAAPEGTPEAKPEAHRPRGRPAGAARGARGPGGSLWRRLLGLAPR